MHRDNCAPWLGSAWVMYPGMMLIGTRWGDAAAGWPGDAGSSELAGSCGTPTRAGVFFQKTQEF